jgi:hypothetical protein
MGAGTIGGKKEVTMTNEKLKPCPCGAPAMESQLKAFVCCSRDGCALKTQWLTKPVWDAIPRPSADAQGLAEWMQKRADAVERGKHRGRAITISEVRRWADQVASLTLPPSEPPAGLEEIAQRLQERIDGHDQADGLAIEFHVDSIAHIIDQLRSYRPEPAGERSDAVGEVEKSLREMSVWFEERRREKVAYGDSEIMSLSLHRLSKKTLKLADKLAGSGAGYYCEWCKIVETEPHPCESCNGRKDTPSGLGFLACDDKGECGSYQAHVGSTPEPHPDATTPSPSVAAVMKEMEVYTGRESDVVAVEAAKIKRWISQLRAATAGTGEVPRVWVVYHDDEPHVFARNADAGEFADDCHATPFGCSVIGGAPQPEKDGAECSECDDGPCGGAAMAKCLRKFQGLSEALKRDLADEREECNRWREVLIACYGALGETGAFVSIPDHIKRIMADLAAEREAHEETTSGLTGEINRLRRSRDDERARADELETQLDSTRHRASEAEARAAHEIRIARHQGEQRIKAEKRVRELETQLEAVGDAAVRSLVQLAEKHSQNEPCAVSCEYFHCDSLLPRCGKTGETFPTKDDCPLPKLPRPSTESGEGTDNNEETKTMNLDADRIGEIGVKGPSTEQVDSAAQSGRANREGMELVGERIREHSK